VNLTFLKAVVAVVPASMLFSGSVVLFRRGKTLWSFLQLLGAGCLEIVVLAHFSEALNLFPWMHWGLEHSAGHYLDLSSAVLGLTLFPTGYLLHFACKPTRLMTTVNTLSRCIVCLDGLFVLAASPSPKAAALQGTSRTPKDTRCAVAESGRIS
jgi:hypothetical protein